MLTIHHGTGVRPCTDEDRPADAGHALVVSADRIAAVGPFRELYEEFGAGARVREWPGVITPGLHRARAEELLEHAYFPDPREAAELGTEPLTGEALAALEMTEARWGGSARRGLRELLATGTTSLSGHFRRTSVRTAVERSPIRVLPEARPRTLAPSGAADFAVFAPDGSCLATVLGGRLLHRSR
ncbi:hypothetical protein [Streptomyces sp. ODS28]|uniref:hypothetical protein n=1 Tax=Streptomyces sp. ODS28 TaxID=3136688 RepID=UPI0031ECCC67